MKQFTLLIFLAATYGCAGTKAWKATEGTSDVSTIKTGWGEISIRPDKTNAVGLMTEVTVRNSSGEDVAFKIDEIKLEDESGEISDALSAEQVEAKVSGSMAFSSMLVGGSYASSRAASAVVSNQVSDSLLRDGKILSKSSKKGFLVFKEPKSLAHLKFRVTKALAGVDSSAEFVSTEPVKKNAVQY